MLIRYTVNFCLIAISVALLSLCGCGYSIHPQSALSIKEIEIGLIENRTLEPKLQDKLHRALTEELMKQGIRVSRGADHKIVGTIKGFELVGLSEKGGVMVEYRVQVSAQFKLLDREGKVVTARDISSPFIVTLTDQGDLGRLLAQKDIAEEQAMSDISMEVVGAILAAPFK